MPIISVENLSKKFLIAQEGKERYEMMSQQVGNIFSKIFTKNIITTSKTTEDFWALRHINFKVEQGEKLGIIGRNGAGKSTLLKILSQITQPTEGKIQIRGRVASLLEVGTGFHPELTGRENIFLNGAILGMSRAEIKKKFDEIVAFAEVEKFLDTPVKRYSSGMYVRLAFAIAAHLEPEILIVDEVLAVGDAAFQRKCLGKMEDVSQQGRTILFVSHNMSTLKSLCNSILYLKQGELITKGSVESTIKEYLSENQKVVESGRIPRNIHRKRNTGEVFFDAIYITNSKNEPSNELYYGENFTIHLELAVLKKIQQATIQIIIASQSGENAITISDCINEVYQFKDYEPGVYKVAVAVNTRLLPIGFNVSAFIALSTGKPLDWVEHVAPFNVSNISIKQGADYPWGVIHGYAEQHDGTWNYTQVN